MTQPILELTTNVSQIFTELYKNYGIITNPDVNVFEDSLYIEGLQSQSIRQRLNDRLYKYHLKEGTLDLYINPNQPLATQKFLPGNGSTQLYKGLVYAMATSYPEKDFLFVQKIPYFGGHETAVTVFPYTNAVYQGYNDPSEIVKKPNTVIVEFVTSPNNPDGTFREPETNPDVIIGDFVFTSDSFGPDGDGYITKNLEWLQQYREKGIPIFSYNSASKQFGHTGDRLGYMWFPTYDQFGNSIYKQFNNFLAITVGSNLYGASNFLDLLMPLNKLGKEIRLDANNSLCKRMRILTDAILTRYPGSDITSVEGSPTMFVKINSPKIILPDVTASDVIFEDTNVRTADGSIYGADDTYVRINIMALSEDLSTFANRLIDSDNYCSCESYSPKDFLCYTYKKYKYKIVCNSKYVVSANDRVLKVDAYRNDVIIYLPDLLGYEQPMNLRIKRIDNSCYKIKIRSDTLSFKLRPYQETELLWRQPYYQNGEWVIRKYAHQSRYEKVIKSNVSNTKSTIQDVSHLYMV